MDREYVTAAGCVVFRAGGTEWEVLLIWTKLYPDPTLPKGKIEPSESALACALREVFEETGYVVEALKTAPVTTETMLDKYPPIVHKTIHWFPARAVSGSPEHRTEKHLISRVDWLPVSEAVRQMRRADEITAVERCLHLVS